MRIPFSSTFFNFVPFAAILCFSGYFTQTAFSATPPSAQPSILSIASEQDFLSARSKENVLESVGMGKMLHKMMAQSPIQKLADIAQSGGMGARLNAVMKDVAVSEMQDQIQSLSNQSDLSAEELGPTMIVDTAVESGDLNGGQNQQMYPPRLAIDFEQFPTALNNDSWQELRSERLNHQIQSRLNEKLECNIRVDFEKQTLILSGTVPTERLKRVAGLIARMEPGVARVRNDLQVGSSLEDFPNPKETPLLVP